MGARAALVLCGAPAERADEGKPAGDNGLVATPPVGWNSWNKFACQVSEATICDAADAMASNGVRETGYRYTVIDDCWDGARTAEGSLTHQAEGERPVAARSSNAGQKRYRPEGRAP